jgi:hypothetical protein
MGYLHINKFVGLVARGVGVELAPLPPNKTAEAMPRPFLYLYL